MEPGAKRRRDTDPGIGDPDERPRARAGVRTAVSCLTAAVRSSSVWSPRQTMPIIPPPDEEGEWEPEGRTRPMPQCIDDVGPATVAVGLGMDPFVAPRCTASAAEIKRARIEPKEAFLLSLLDGQTPLRSIIDESNMREDVVVASLDRLVRLGLVKVD